LLLIASVKELGWVASSFSNLQASSTPEQTLQNRLVDSELSFQPILIQKKKKEIGSRPLRTTTYLQQLLSS
jgi:hypothetical protein